MTGAHRLAPCPRKRNCVSSLEPAGRRHMEPIRYTGSPDEARRRLLAVLRAWPRTRIVADEPDYLHVECRSAVFRFVDDVEFAFAPEAGLIHFRSASRVGSFDWGVNRKRMETIRRRVLRAGEGFS
jgi:uncharacterized protein (DUF1499 family)